MNASLSSAAASMHGSLHGTNREFDGVSTDTRTLAEGQLFFALSGPNFNGGEFVGQACDKGAAAAVVSNVVDEPIAQISVDDTRRALGRLGATWRSEQPATVIGITGSNGKTTLKEMIAACLGRIAPTLATAGNLNNEIGLPLMLLRIEPSHRYAVLEMGANHGGEIAYLTSLTRPDIVVITNAGVAHLEGFGSVRGVAEAKGEILKDSKRPRVAILNADDEYHDFWSSLVADIDVVSFGLDEGADVSASNVQPQGESTRFQLRLEAGLIEVNLPLAGVHNVRNACAAAAVAAALGIAPEVIATGLESIEPVAGRLQPIAGRNGATIYDDSYNANPNSVIAAGEFLASLPGQKWLVLGDMYELGEAEAELHCSVGQALRDAGIDRLFTFGELTRHTSDAFGAGAGWFDSLDALLAAVSGDLSAATNVLVKGSRGMRMERVVDALRAPDAMRKEA